MSGSYSPPRRLTWKPRSMDGDMLADIIEILHEIGFSDKKLRKAAAHYLKTRFPDVNCTLSRANLREFTEGLLPEGLETLISERASKNL